MVLAIKCVSLPLIFNVICFQVAFGSAGVIRNVCEADTDCLQGYYCYNTGNCVKCSDCAIYKRNPSTWRTCSKTALECGSCLLGYEEDILSGGNQRYSCTRSTALQVTAPPSNTSNAGIHLSWSSLGIISILFFIFIYAICIRKPGNRLIPSLPQEEPPPYSTLDLPSATSNSQNEHACSCESNRAVSSTGSNSSDRAEVREVIFEWQKPKEDNLQQAIPFRDPAYNQPLNALLNENENEDEFGSDDDDDDNGSTSEEPVILSGGNIELEDENTLPSDWTPYPPQCVDCSDSVAQEEQGTEECQETQPPTKRLKTGLESTAE